MKNVYPILHVFFLFLLNSGLYSQWIQQPFANSSDHLYSVFFVNENTGWISGYDGSLTEGLVLKTTDGGASWDRQIIADTGGLHSIYFVNENVGWALGDSGKIINTTDGGISWQSQNSGTDHYLSSVHFYDENNGWICYGYGIGFPGTQHFGVILNTSDGGQNWIIQKQVEDFEFKSIFFIDNNKGWAAGGNHQNNTEIYVTIDGGNTWTPRTINTSWRFFRSIHFVDQSIGWLVGESGIILKTTDGGNTWFPQTNGYQGYNLYSCYAVNQNKVFTVGRYGTILYTADGGGNWTEQESGTNMSLNSTFFTNSTVGWIIGYAGTFLKTTTGGITAIEEISSSIPDDYKLKQNHPNPFNSSTSITFSLPKNSITKLNIYDLKGSLIKELVNGVKPAGQYTISFNLSEISSGVYIYQLEANNFRNAKKLILIK